VAWLALVGRVATVDEGRLAETLAAVGAPGCHIEPVSAVDNRVTVYVHDDDPVRLEAAQTAFSTVTSGGVEVLAVGERDWLQPYREGLSAFPVGALWWVDPHPARPSPAPPGRVRLVIEPREAFGSGSHESTRLLLLELEEAGPLAGARVLDVGTGSGILSFAAARLGAGRVVAVDVDPVALWVARRSSRDQDLRSEVLWLVGSSGGLTGAEHDLILCNMLPTEFTPLLADLRDLLAPGGRLLLSGLLGSERDEVAGAVEAAGLQVRYSRSMGEWCSLAARQAGGS
jgi:ribosomal protein L11 methyltransferase